MPKINVIKPFMFSPPLKLEQRLNTERFFPVGEHEVDDETFNHEWIKAGADGKIESAAARLTRLKMAEDMAKQQAEQAAVATAEAEAAMARMRGNEKAVATGSAAEIEAELNTPVSQLRGGKKKAVVAEKDEGAGEAA